MSEMCTPGTGATLTAAREAKGLSVSEVADRLKLTARQVEALEAEEWSLLPNAVFVRGFLRNYARLLEIDADSLLVPVAGVEATSQHITAPSAGVRLGRSPLSRWVLLPLALATLFILVVALLYNWLKQGEDVLIEPAGAPPAATSLQVPAAAQPNGQQAQPPARTQTIVETLSTRPQVIDKPDKPGTPPPPPTSAVQPTPAPKAAAQAEQTQPGSTATLNTSAADRRGQATLRFNTEDEAWIQVVDGRGERFSKLVHVGSEESFSGKPPFSLVVGNAARVRMTYNGQFVDLKPFIGEKVARLTLE